MLTSRIKFRCIANNYYNKQSQDKNSYPAIYLKTGEPCYKIEKKKKSKKSGSPFGFEDKDFLHSENP